MQESDLPEPNQLQMLIPIRETSQASVSIAVCTGGSCEQRCSPHNFFFMYSTRAETRPLSCK